ncbi:3-phosphoshikimate 1-carboxyvinyltransferase [bacterium]|nr:3-phosphoshikimate 1-carboxyvinyltransferase [bacterium]
MLKGEIIIPADKSISHRSLIFSALSKSKVKIKNLSLGEDCISTLKILSQLGVKYEFISDKDLILDSTSGLKSDKLLHLDCGNSGTTTRLMAGVLSGLEVEAELFGDKSLSSRPMKRIIEPLRLMGANIQSNDNRLPIKIKGQKLKGIEYLSPVSSAQVKSCIILAGLNAEGITRVYEKDLSRNHTEIMLEYLGANIKTGHDNKGYFVEIKKSDLKAKDIEIAGDISSASFFMVAASIVPNSDILIKNVGINPTRSGILDVFKQAKINFEILNERVISNEPVSDIRVCYTPNIQPFEIKGDIIPRLIDEIPILAILATQANGTSIVKDASDLRNKESDRIKTISESLTRLNCKIEEFQDGFTIKGKTLINSDIALETHLDHRLAMSFYVLNLINQKNISINGMDCINTSFPEFLQLMKKIST